MVLNLNWSWLIKAFLLSVLDYSMVFCIYFSSLRKTPEHSQFKYTVDKVILSTMLDFRALNLNVETKV